MRRAPALGSAVLVLALAAPAAAAPVSSRDAAAWLDGLYDRVAADVAAGRPIVVEVHVPLCDNRVLRCGNARLGDGDAPGKNLYWATSGGFLGWFGRAGSGWRQVAVLPATGDQLDGRVWRRALPASGALRARGVRGSVEVFVIARAWRGTEIGQAMAAWATDLYGETPREVTLPDGRSLAGGGAAHVVAFVGHNGWMDVADFAWPAATARATKGAIAIACLTESYLGDAVPAPGRVPLLMTRSLLFAGAHGLEGAVTAFARGASLAAIHDGAAHAYAAGQDKPFRRARAAFTNPASRLWGR